MKPIVKNKNNNKNTEEKLEKQLKLVFLLIIIVSIIIGLTFTVFATNFGSIFKIFSKKDNVDELVIKPTKPILNSIDESTNKEYINISGYSQKDNEVQLYVNGPEIFRTNTDENGQFEFNNVKLINGRNVVFVKATNQKGYQSDASDNLIITLDRKEPEIEIESPKDEDNIKNLNKRITIKGKINEKSSLKINDQVAIVKPDLTFEHLLGVEEGEVEIKIVAIDQAGNETTEELKVTYQRDNN